MGFSATKKTNLISQIVRLKHLVKRWKCKSLRRRSILCYSSDDESSSRRTPSGSVALYVGTERRRFVIPTRFLNLPVFVALLNQAEEEFGFQTTGGLALPCDTDFFTFVVNLLEDDEARFRAMGLDGFLKMRFEHQISCKESSSPTSPPFNVLTPMLNKARV